MLFKVCVFVKLLCVQITISQVLHQDVSNSPPTTSTTKRHKRQINNLALPSNGIPIANIPNLPCGNEFPNAASNVLQNFNNPSQNVPAHYANNMPIDRLIQNNNGINGGLLFNNMPTNNGITNLNNLAVGNSLPFSNNMAFGNSVPFGNTIPVLPNGYNEQVLNGIQNSNNIHSGMGISNNAAAALPNMNRMQFANGIQSVTEVFPPNSAQMMSLNVNNLANSYNLPVNNHLLKDNQMLLSNINTNLPQNNLPIANGLQNQFNFPVNNMLPNTNMFVANGITNLPPNNIAIGNGLGNAFNVPIANDFSHVNNNCFLSGPQMANYEPMYNLGQGISNFQMVNGIGNNNYGLPFANNNCRGQGISNFQMVNGMGSNSYGLSFTSNIPTNNAVPYYGPQGNNINNPFTLSSNIPLQTIVPNMNSMPSNGISNNVPLWDNGLSANIGEGLPFNGLTCNNGLPYNNMPLPNNFHIPYYSPHNLPMANSVPIANTWQYDHTFANVPVKNNVFQNRMPEFISMQIEKQPGFTNNFNIRKELAKNLQIEGFGNLPLLNGLPVTGITETVTVLNNPI